MLGKRSLQDLITVEEPAWPMVQCWIQARSNSVEVLPADEAAGRNALTESQVTLRSPMGAVVYHTGGLLVDSSWLRLLGSGHSKIQRSMPDWNRGRSTTPAGGALGSWLIADDVIGGFYALNGGACGPGAGQVFYFAPDLLRWEPMNGMNYSKFLVWSFGSGVSQFYESLRWAVWESEVSSIKGDQALSFYPFLWTKEGKEQGKCSRRACPIAEIYSLNVKEFSKQLQSSPERH
jgi:hypothetical protein